MRRQNGVYSSHSDEIVLSNRLIRLKILMLDSRSNKDRKGTKDGDFLGEEQWLWIREQLKDALQYDLIVIGSSIQVLRTDALVEESWIEFPHQRERLLRLLSLVNSFTNVIILSGDIHQAEISVAKCHQFIPSSTQPVVSSPPYNRTNLLWEFTSSGFTHTFAYTSPLASASSEFVSVSRGWAKEFILNAYQVS